MEVHFKEINLSLRRLAPVRFTPKIGGWRCDSLGEHYCSLSGSFGLLREYSVLFFLSACAHLLVLLTSFTQSVFTYIKKYAILFLLINESEVKIWPVMLYVLTLF